MKDHFVILVQYQGKEYGEVEEGLERTKYRIEEWMEHDVNLEEMQILHIENHIVTRMNGRDFISKF